MHAPMGSNSSFVWRSIDEGRVFLKEGCRWMIGDGQNVNVFGEIWTANRVVIKEEDTHHSNPFLCVADLFLASTKSWNGVLINQLFPKETPDQAIRTPLFTLVLDDTRMWWSETSGVYSVCSAYRLIMSRILDMVICLLTKIGVVFGG